MRFVHGHCSEDINDYDSIAYGAYVIRIISLKKWNNLSNWDFCHYIHYMKKYGYKIPKFALKRYNRLMKKYKEKDSWMYNFIMDNIKND